MHSWGCHPAIDAYQPNLESAILLSTRTNRILRVLSCYRRVPTESWECYPAIDAYQPNLESDKDEKASRTPVSPAEHHAPQCCLLSITHPSVASSASRTPVLPAQHHAPQCCLHSITHPSVASLACPTPARRLPIRLPDACQTPARRLTSIKWLQF